ncbi:MAG: hypothetical protein PVJ24_05360 [Methyloceanibacter sp.]|jgi:hypothetical protein
MIENMTVTQLLAAFVGLYMIAAGIGFLRDSNAYAKMLREFRDDTALGFTTGAFVLALGAGMVAVHNDWTGPLAIVVSVIAWWTLIKGFCLLAIRDRFLRVADAILIENGAHCLASSSSSWGLRSWLPGLLGANAEEGHEHGCHE